MFGFRCCCFSFWSDHEYIIVLYRYILDGAAENTEILQYSFSQTDLFRVIKGHVDIRLLVFVLTVMGGWIITNLMPLLSFTL